MLGSTERKAELARARDQVVLTTARGIEALLKLAVHGSDELRMQTRLECARLAGHLSVHFDELQRLTSSK